MKPEEEKTWWEKAGDWCKKHWKLVATIGKNLLLGGGSEGMASLVSNLGDILIAGEDISIAEVIFDAVISFGLGAAMTGLGSFLKGKLPQININGITKGRGNWDAIFRGRMTMIANNSAVRMPAKILFKGLAAQVVKDAWDFTLEPFKTAFGEFKDWIKDDVIFEEKLYG